MKTIYLIRHAKSSWNHANLDDFDRPLNDRGKKDAPKMAEILEASGVKFDAIISSPAKRAVSTAREFKERVLKDDGEYTLNQSLYLPTTHQILDVVTLVSDEVETLALFGHNPGFSDFLDYMTGAGLDMPTCAIAQIELDVDSWKEVSGGMGTLRSFDYPKKHSNE